MASIAAHMRSGAFRLAWYFYVDDIFRYDSIYKRYGAFTPSDGVHCTIDPLHPAVRATLPTRFTKHTLLHRLWIVSGNAARLHCTLLSLSRPLWSIIMIAQIGAFWNQCYRLIQMQNPFRLPRMARYESICNSSFVGTHVLTHFLACKTVYYVLKVAQWRSGFP